MGSSSSDVFSIDDKIKRVILIVQKASKILRFIDNPITLNTRYTFNRAGELKQKSEFYSEYGVLVYENHVAHLERILNETLGDCSFFKKLVNGKDIFLLRSGIFLECVTEETIIQDSRGNQMPALYQQTRTNAQLIRPQEIVLHYGQEFESEFVWHLKNAIVWEIYTHPRKQSILAPVEKSLSKMGALTIKDLVHSKIAEMIPQIRVSNDIGWRNPASKRKAEIVAKLGILRALIEAGKYAEGYYQLFHRIKPMLTGLRTNEDEVPWGDGIFANPWLIDPIMQEQYRLDLNALLRDISLLYPPDSPLAPFTGLQAHRV